MNDEQQKQTSESQPEEPRKIPSQELFQGTVEILIEHGGVTYRLRKTRSGKLILHK